jgi:hypothetical protein
VENVGIVAFAFGQQVTKASGPSNEAIAQVAISVRHDEQARGNNVFLSTQWEVALYCDARSEYPDFQVSDYNDPKTHYIDTKGVLNASLQYFKGHDVKRVILITHPFHLLFIRLILATKLWRIGTVKLDTSYNKRLSAIPYDKSSGNRQPWTRGPFAFLIYLLKILLTKKHGN